ncbi:MAG TPA: hypothetical protein VFN67_24260 [Polyangiales bacterium]|nr:hypothetical protein [Polyangiales bacterium]
MLRLWLIQLFWIALALPGYALLRRWDRASLERGFLFGLARCYLASLILLTPVAVLGYWQHWPLWSLSCAYVLGVSIGAWVFVRDWRSLRAAFAGNWLAAVSCCVICFDLWLGLRAGAHTLGDAAYHIARVRMLIAEGLSNWDPIVQQQRPDIIYHTNLYHALIAVSGQLTRSDAALAWLATWPFAKLLVAAGVGQLAVCAFGSASYGWLASLAVLVSQSAYSALPLPNTLAPLAILPMGLCAGAEVVSGERSQLAAAWLAASAIALAQLHALNAIFLALVVGPVLLGVLCVRALPLRAAPAIKSRALLLGLLACAASSPWLAIAGAERIQGLLLSAADSPAQERDSKQPTAPGEADAVVAGQPDANEPNTAEPPTADLPPTAASTPPTAASTPPTAASTPPTAASTPPTVASTPPTVASAPPTAASKPPTVASTPPTAAAAPPQAAPISVAAEPIKPVYKADRFRKLANGLSVYEPSQLRGPRDVYLFGLGAVLITLALRPRLQLLAAVAFVAMACAWLVVPPLCSLLLFVTGAPWAALRISQVLPVVFYALVPAAPMFWFSRWREIRAPLVPLFAFAAALIGWTQISHGEPWTLERLWQHALELEARTQWQSVEDKQKLLCAHLPAGEMVMAHPRWDYGLPMHCRNFALALAPGRGWHGLPYMPERRADIDEFFRDGTSGPRRIELMRKYSIHYVYTSQRLARRIVSSLPRESRILAQARAGAVLSIDY